MRLSVVISNNTIDTHRIFVIFNVNIIYFDTEVRMAILKVHIYFQKTPEYLSVSFFKY